jgi:hypothetical protein
MERMREKAGVREVGNGDDSDSAPEDEYLKEEERVRIEAMDKELRQSFEPKTKEYL